MAAKYSYEIEQGATFLPPLITWKDETGVAINLTGWTARMQIRPNVSSDTILVSLTTENGGITLGGIAGTIQLTMTADATAALTWADGEYDLELVNGAYVKRLLRGKVKVSKEVTR
jgi:hypothetical protein